MTKQEILDRSRELGVQFVRLQFTDIFGTVKNVEIPVGQLERALDNEIMFDGSSIEGFMRIEESDMNLRPDPETFAVYPWRNGDTSVVRLICDVYTPDGQPFEGDPRYVLRRTLNEAASMGFTANVGPECEFFLFEDREGSAAPRTQDRGSYFDLSPADGGEEARREIVTTLDTMGFEVETAHHEVSPGQHEVDFKYADALTTADRVVTLKYVTRIIARRHGFHATFMPKPVYGINGSGMHCNLSLFRGGVNAFYDARAEYQLSKEALHFIGGLLHHVPAFTAVTNPLVNSYKRVVPGFEAPVYISWSASNRSALIRVPASRANGTRLELRSPDPSCNPYLAFAVAIRAGLDGIRRQITPPDPVRANIFEMTPEERASAGITSLPGSLEEALTLLEANGLVRETLGEHVFRHFAAAKSCEAASYRTHVHPWELDQYLDTI